MSKRTWVKTVAWDFGPPGHGKGPWDGISGTVKRYLRNVSVRLEAPGAEKSKIVFTESGNMNTPEDVFQQLKGHFECESWKAKQSGGAKIDEFHISFVTEEDIGRPRTLVEFDRIEGISSHYQSFGMRPSAVLKRKFSCWCPPCTAALCAGPAARAPLHRHHTMADRTKKGIKKWKELYNIAGCQHNSTINADTFRLDAHDATCQPKIATSGRTRQRGD